MTDRRTLVTGGAGFIGSHLVEALLDRGDEVRVLDNFSTGFRANLAAHLSEVELLEGDLTSYERAHNAVRGCDAVLHQAALPSVPRSVQDPLTSHAVNAGGTLNLLLAARDSGVRRVVFASSSSVYGANPILPKTEDLATLPVSPYAVAKLAAEGYGRTFTEVYGLETVALRYFNVFGPRQDPTSQYAAVVPNFIQSALRGEASVVYGDGEQTRDFTFVENVVQANLLAVDVPGIGGEVFNVALGQRTSINLLLQTISSLAGTTIEPVRLPARPGEVRHSEADIQHATDRLGYRPAVSLEEGLGRTFEFFSSEESRGLAGARHP